MVNCVKFFRRILRPILSDWNDVMSTTLLLLSISVFALAIAGMAIGVIISNRRLRGSCGGLAGRHDREGNSVCEMCTDPSPKCDGVPAAAVEDDV